jgi:hypothetical protein
MPNAESVADFMIDDFAHKFYIDIILIIVLQLSFAAVALFDDLFERYNASSILYGA